jgi:protein lifeguard
LGMLVMVTWILLILGLILVWFPPEIVSKLQLVYAGVSALMFSGYILVDTELIMKRGIFGVDDYCFAALCIYIDLIGLFINILSLIGNRRD